MTILFNRVGEATSTDNDSLNRKLEELSDEVARYSTCSTTVFYDFCFRTDDDGFYSG